MSVQIVKPKIIGLTGGIASGKSEASKYFRNRGFQVIESDEIVRELWQNVDFLTTARQMFPEGFVNNLLEKVKIRDLMIADNTFKKQLEEQIHPLVLREIEKRIKKSTSNIIIVDMPLLFEIGYDKNVAETVLITTTKKHQLARLVARDNLSQAKALSLINLQMPLEVKEKLATIVVRNDLTIRHLWQELAKIVAVWRK